MPFRALTFRLPQAFPRCCGRLSFVSAACAVIVAARRVWPGREHTARRVEARSPPPICPFEELAALAAGGSRRWRCEVLERRDRWRECDVLWLSRGPCRWRLRHRPPRVVRTAVEFAGVSLTAAATAHLQSVRGPGRLGKRDPVGASAPMVLFVTSISSRRDLAQNERCRGTAWATPCDRQPWLPLTGRVDDSVRAWPAKESTRQLPGCAFVIPGRGTISFPGTETVDA